MSFKGTFSAKLPKEILELRHSSREGGIPSAEENTLNYLSLVVSMSKPKEILEIGTATGVSGSAMLSSFDGSTLTTIEKDEESFYAAKANFEKFGLLDRVKQYLGDAGDIINFLDKKFDFIFLDGAKARYYDYLFDVKRLLNKGGVLFADNVLFRGFIDGEKSFHHREYTIVRNMRDFLNDFLNDENYSSAIQDIGDGVLIACKL